MIIDAVDVWVNEIGIGEGGRGRVASILYPPDERLGPNNEQ